MNVSRHWEEIQRKLDSIKEKQLFREIKTYLGVDFCSNDYLGLATNSSMLEYYRSITDLYPFGSTASRLVRGNYDSMDLFENEFASFVEGEAALLVSNGFVANFGLIDSIAAPDCYVFTDRLNHASILDGIRISGAKKILQPPRLKPLTILTAKSRCRRSYQKTKTHRSDRITL